MEPKNMYTQDSDNDGLTDAQELALGTNPLSLDTDGDGQTDLEEVQRDLNPIYHQRKERSYDLEL
ncbi:thrombospondin type 3 repeat-containing protein [Streptococcus vestibularis]|uniref:thrombospondin type 3 repeat-containing protein n=1 Tax=Streptococcus vestibularis TaxID=1343 RepID=UPI001D0BBC9C|nr:thrombospondin type 3 repeat-containing protein [Streptococcus vestibularis]MCB8555998.1 thrombospondin type 3 repeat-containing protein [Streptococcus vestibularis]MCB8586862.1 thrombospondin type 3 repeat-containing protein [Streptococcus vestibularis]